MSKQQVKKALKLSPYDNNKEYKVETISNNAVYTKKSGNYLPDFYYLIV